ncbi:Carbamoyl-phosphate synthase, partial [Kickxella alabastrina]
YIATQNVHIWHVLCPVSSGPRFQSVTAPKLKTIETTAVEVETAVEAEGTPKTRTNRLAEILSPHNGKSPFYVKNELNVRQFLHEDRFFFAIAQEMHPIMQPGRCLPLLAGRFMATIFYEPSSHISSLFQTAMLRLGSQPGSVVGTSCMYSVPVINTGDGIGEHLLQAMLNGFTIREVMGTVSSLTITLASDLRNGCTMHSLACSKSIKGDVDLHAPCVMQNKLITLTDDVLANTDVLYTACMQKEHFDFLEE